MKYFLDNVLREEYDDESRIYTAWDESGVQTEQRPYTDEENAAANESAYRDEQTRRDELLLVNERALIAATLALQPPPATGAVWVQPTVVGNAYAMDSLVEHNGSTWLSLTNYNVWEPGVSGWREQVTVGYPAWVQPTGAHDAYGAGDRVTHNAQDWESSLASNVWEPGVYGWVVITP
jgi:hypothetical protein